MKAYKIKWTLKWTLGKMFGGSHVPAESEEEAKKQLLEQFPSAKITEIKEIEISE